MRGFFAYTCYFLEVNFEPDLLLRWLRDPGIKMRYFAYYFSVWLIAIVVSIWFFWFAMGGLLSDIFDTGEFLRANTFVIDWKVLQAWIGFTRYSYTAVCINFFVVLGVSLDFWDRPRDISPLGFCRII